MLHYCFAGMIFSYPYMLRSEPVQWFGNNSQYFNPQRLGQVHMVVYFIMACLNVAMFLFESAAVSCWNGCYGTLSIRCGQLLASCMNKEYNDVDLNEEGFILTDDFLMEINFGTLYKMYKVSQRDNQRYK